MVAPRAADLRRMSLRVAGSRLCTFSDDLCITMICRRRLLDETLAWSDTCAPAAALELNSKKCQLISANALGAPDSFWRARPKHRDMQVTEAAKCLGVFLGPAATDTRRGKATRKPSQAACQRAQCANASTSFLSKARCVDIPAAPLRAEADASQRVTKAPLQSIPSIVSLLAFPQVAGRMSRGWVAKGMAVARSTILATVEKGIFAVAMSDNTVTHIPQPMGVAQAYRSRRRPMGLRRVLARATVPRTLLGWSFRAVVPRDATAWRGSVEGTHAYVSCPDTLDGGICAS